jgi:hypothetical protein
MQKTETFEVADDLGRRRRVTQFAVPSGEDVIGGGSAPDQVRFELDDGTELEPMLGAQQFVDRRGGRRYSRV